MAVLIRHRAQGIGQETYDQVAPTLVDKLKQEPGFVLHVAFEDSQGFCVAEIWDSQEQHDAWFNENVVPNVPAEIKQEVVQIHNVVAP
jgi:quinol monooxygenase YgiN